MMKRSNEAVKSLKKNVFDDFSSYNFSMESGCETAPIHLFRHIEKNESLNFTVHQIVEVDLAVLSKNCSKLVPRGEFLWPCEVLCATSVQCRLRWLQQAEINSDLNSVIKGGDRIVPFWLKVDKHFWELVHPIGHSQQHNLDWISPSQLLQCKSINEILDRKHRPGVPELSADFIQRISSSVVSPLIFAKKAVYLRDMFRVGDYLECKTLADPSSVWPIKILKNYNGRLLVSWLGIHAESDIKRGTYVCHNNVDGNCLDEPIFSIFMWDPRIRPLGWSLAHSFRYKAPQGLMIPPIEITSDFIRAFSPLDDVIPWKGLLLFAPEPPKHLLSMGSKLEAFDNSKPEGARPATIVRIISDRYFVVRFDVLPSQDSRKLVEPREFVAHVGMPQIMPPNMCRYYGLKLFPPENWPSNKSFDWGAYASTLLSLSKVSSNLPSYLQMTDDSYQSLIKSLSIPIDRFFNSTSPKAKRSDNFELDTYSPLQNIGSSGASRWKRSRGESIDSSGLWVSRDFCPGMKLEMALPSFMWRHIQFTSSGSVEFHESPIITATVIRCQAGLLWLLPDLLENWSPHANREYTVNTPIVIESSSASLYPLGWSRDNDHPFIPPSAYLRPALMHLPKTPVWKSQMKPKPSFPHVNGIVEISHFYAESEVCPKVYVNSSCYCGPHIIESRLKFLPREFGPGPVELMLVTILSRLSTTVDKKASVIRALDADWVKKLSNIACNNINGKRRKEAKAEALRRHHTGMNLATFSFRCPNKGLSIPVTLEVCKRARAVDEFLRQVCIGLDACPFLLSTRQYGAFGQECPLRCHNLINPHRGDNNFLSPIVVITDDTIVSTAALLNSELRISKGNSKRPLIVSSRLLNDRSLLPPLLYDWNPSATKSIQFKNDNKSVENCGPRPAKRLRGSVGGCGSGGGPNIGFINTGRKAPRIGNAVKSRSNFRNLHGDSTQGIDVPMLTSDPINWTPLDLIKHLEATDCMDLWPWLASQAVDGQSVMLLPSAQELHSDMGLQWDLAVKVARLADRLRLAYRKQYCKHSV